MLCSGISYQMLVHSCILEDEEEELELMEWSLDRANCIETQLQQCKFQSCLE